MYAQISIYSNTQIYMFKANIVGENEFLGELVSFIWEKAANINT